MTSLYKTTDATMIYRETSALRTVRLDGTGDIGSLMAIIRDGVFVLEPPSFSVFDDKIPKTPNGDIVAVAALGTQGSFVRR